MKSLKESLLDTNFDYNIDIMSIFNYPKKDSTVIPASEFGFQLKSSDGFALIDTIIMALEAEGAKEKSYNAARLAMRAGKCAMFVTSYQSDDSKMLYLATKPDPAAASNINNTPFLCIVIQPLYGYKDYTAVYTGMKRGPKGLWGLPGKTRVEKSYVIPNELYVKMFKYILDHNCSTVRTSGASPEEHKQYYYKVCDIINKR